MNKFFTLIVLLVSTFYGYSQNYSFTLVQNSNYNYSLVAIPDFDSGGNMPNLESFGTTIMLPDGATLSNITFNYLNLDSTAFFTPSQLDANDPGQNRSATVISSSSGVASIPTHTINQGITLITFDVLGTPSSGFISILDNTSTLAQAAGNSFDSFISIDETGGNSPSNLFSTLTGTSSFNFSTLSIQKDVQINLSISPNPTKGIIYFDGNPSQLKSIDIYTITGKHVMVIKKGVEKINISHLEPSIYFIKLNSENASKTFKIIKE